MKKVFLILGIILALSPILFFVSCKSDDANAEAVRNRTYYVTSLKKDSEDISQSVTDRKMKIIFTTDHFKVIIGLESDPSTYGYYMGTYSTDGDKVTLNTTEYGGIFPRNAKNSAYSDYYFTTLLYSNGKLHTEFVNKSKILQYVLEVPKAD